MNELTETLEDILRYESCVCFTDYGALRKHVSCIPLRGHMIGIQKMPFTTFIQVSNLSAEEAVDSILDYFAGWIGRSHGVRCEQKTETSTILQVHHHSGVATSIF